MSIGLYRDCCLDRAPAATPRLLEGLGRVALAALLTVAVPLFLRMPVTSDVAFYDWLLSIGLTPRKSLTLGAIDVPDAFLLPLARGLLDGDGSVCKFTDRPTPAKYPDYTYERLWVFFLSASRAHIDWLRGRLTTAVGINGYVERIRRAKRHDLFRLKYGKRESIVLLRTLYADRGAPCLERKRRIWDEYSSRILCAEGGT